MNNKGSFTTVAQNIVAYNTNVLNLLTQLNSLFVTSDDSVTVDFVDTNQVLTTYDIPSWGFLTKEIQRLNNNINTLFAINENGAIIQTAENIWKKIILVDLNQEPNQIQSLNQIQNFEANRNHFFDALLNPSLKVRFDLTDKIEDDVREVLSRRYIVEFERNVDGSLTNNGQTALNSFNSLFRNKVDIVLGDFLEWHETTPGVLNPNNPYFDEEKFELEPNQLLYDGLFSVLQTEEDSLNRKLWYHLNTLEYTLIATGEIRTLAVDDEIIINRPQTSTRYRVLEVSTAQSNPRVILERIEGNEAIPVGEGTIKIYSPTINNKTVKITIGYAERNVVFMKPINTENFLLAKQWSQGTGYFTSDLILLSEDDNNGKTMDEFYVESVSDYGQAIEDLVQQKTPFSLGQLPNTPELLTDNFKVVQINRHLTDNQDRKEIVDKYQKMKQLKSEMAQLDSSIVSKKKESRLATFKSKSAKRTFDNEIKTLVTKKESSSRLLKTVTDEIITLSTSPNTNRRVQAKYRVRGFWDMPEARLVRGTRPQEVVQFKIQYRYVSLDGNESPVESFKLKNSDGTDAENAAYSNWTQVMSDARQRTFDSTEDVWVWEIEDVSDADTPNINQIDIPLQKNERVEIRIKSLSEVGWPENPLESDWSEIFTIDFPEDLSTIVGEEDFILEEASREDTLVQLKSDLGNVDEHLADQTNIGDEEFYHSTDTILAIFKDDQGNDQSLFDYLRTLEQKVTSLQEEINRTRGVLEVFMFRDEEEFVVRNDEEIQFNIECEDYAERFTEDTSVAGRVYRNDIYAVKDFFLKISNTSTSSPLGLLSSKLYTSDNQVYNQTTPQIFWVNDRDELLFNNSTGVTNTQLDNQYVWNVNFDSGNSTTNVSKVSENVGNNFITANSNSLTNVLSATEYNLGYSENSILEFVSNNNSLLDVKKWADTTPSVSSSTKLLTTVHPQIQNLEDIVENNSDKVKVFQAGTDLIIPVIIYFKLNALDSNDGTGKDYDYVDFNNASSTTRHIKRVKFFFENEAENKPFIFRVKFTINRNKVVVQKLSQNNKLTNVARFTYRPFNTSIFDAG